MAYAPEEDGRHNIAPFEFIPWILGQCATVEQARAFLGRINLMDLPFSSQLPLAGQHWIISDRIASIVVEPMRDGLRVRENPTGVLTNNPPFEYQQFNLNNYRGLSRDTRANRFST